MINKRNLATAIQARLPKYQIWEIEEFIDTFAYCLRKAMLSGNSVVIRKLGTFGYRPPRTVHSGLNGEAKVYQQKIGKPFLKFSSKFRMENLAGDES